MFLLMLEIQILGAHLQLEMQPINHPSPCQDQVIAKSLQAMLPFVYQQSVSVLHSPILWSPALQSMDKETRVKVLSFVGYRNSGKW
jgi:hypothetical protein